jgi:hypothetical protein
VKIQRFGFAAICASALLSAAPALAYKDGTYTCKSAYEGIPAAVYKISTVNMGGIDIPYLDISFSYRQEPGDKSSPLLESKLRGPGLVSIMHNGQETIEALMIGSLRFEFDGDKMKNCK